MITKMSLIQEEKIVKKEKKIFVVEESPIQTTKLSAIFHSLHGKFDQIKARLYDPNRGFCAIGALAFDVGIPKDIINNSTYSLLPSYYPQLLDKLDISSDKKLTLGNPYDLMSLIYDLNDRGYSFEYIANELEELGY